MQETPPRFSAVMAANEAIRESKRSLGRRPAKQMKVLEQPSLCVLQHFSTRDPAPNPKKQGCPTMTQTKNYAWIPGLLAVFEEASLLNAVPRSSFYTKAVFGVGGLSDFQPARFKYVMRDLQMIFSAQALKKDFKSNPDNWIKGTFPSATSQQTIVAFCVRHQSTLEKAYRKANETVDFEPTVQLAGASPEPPTPPNNPSCEEITTAEVNAFVEETLSPEELILIQETRDLTFVQYALCCEHLFKMDLPYKSFDIEPHKIKALKQGYSAVISYRSKMQAAKHISELCLRSGDTVIVPPVITHMTEYLLGNLKTIPQVPKSYTPEMLVTYNRENLERAAQEAKAARQAARQAAAAKAKAAKAAKAKAAKAAKAKADKTANVQAQDVLDQESLDTFRARMSAYVDAKGSSLPLPAEEEWGELVFDCGRKIVLRGPVSALSQIVVDAPSA